MRTVKSEKIQALADCILALLGKNALKKIVLSKPDSTDEKKSVIEPVEIGGACVLQVETFSKDNKAFHRNIRDDFSKELVKIFSSYAQINIVSAVGDVQFMRSKNGKETIIGLEKTKKALEAEYEIVKIKGNNNEKNIFCLAMRKC